MNRFPCVLAFLAFCGSVSAQGMQIDGYSTTQSTAVAEEIAAGEAIGGVRLFTGPAGGSIAGGTLTISGQGTFVLDYDGVDDDMTSPMLGNLDLTAGGVNRFGVDVQSFTAPVTVEILLLDLAASSECTLTQSISTTGSLAIPFDQSGTGGSDCTAAASSLDLLSFRVIVGAGGAVVLGPSTSDTPVELQGFSID